MGKHSKAGGDANERAGKGLDASGHQPKHARTEDTTDGYAVGNQDPNQRGLGNTSGHGSGR